MYMKWSLFFCQPVKYVIHVYMQTKFLIHKVLWLREASQTFIPLWGKSHFKTTAWQIAIDPAILAANWTKRRREQRPEIKDFLFCLMDAMVSITLVHVPLALVLLKNVPIDIIIIYCPLLSKMIVHWYISFRPLPPSLYRGHGHTWINILAPIMIIHRAKPTNLSVSTLFPPVCHQEDGDAERVTTWEVRSGAGG